MSASDASDHFPVMVAATQPGEHHRLVRIKGRWRPAAGQREFEDMVFGVLPDLDLDDPEQVHWVEDKGIWPTPQPRPHEIHDHEGHHHHEGHHPNEVKLHRHEKG